MPLLNLLLLTLAAMGLVALLGRIFRSVVRLGLAAAEAAGVAGLAEVSARRGDLTGMAERQALVKTVRRARLRALALVGLWAALLVAPPVLGWGREVWAACSVLWLLPRAPLLNARLWRPNGSQDQPS